MLRNLKCNRINQSHLLFLLFGIMFTLLFISNAHGAVEYGIAANYPGDTGIENDPSFIFRENFEEASISAMTSRWEDISNQNLMSFNSDKPSASAGTKSVFFNGEAHLYRRLLPGYDQLYIRFYAKFDPICTNIHHFVKMGGYNPTSAWPLGGAGIRPAGNERWSTGIEPMGANLAWDFYTYWMHMRSNPSGTYYGNSFSGQPSPYTVNKNEWISVEFMVKMNNPVTSYNGEQAFWINGEKKVHLMQGFPTGTWIWDSFYPGNGSGSAPFEGFQWRNDPALNINFLWLLHYVDTDPSCTVKFDDIVIATQYIGPIVASGGGNNPPTVTLSANTTSGNMPLSVNFTANASDSDGSITQYEWDLDGNGAYEATNTNSTRSYTYNSAGIYNARVRVTDNVGATATSAVTVTVSTATGGSNTPPPSVSGDSGTSSGGGCGFMKNKGLRAKGEWISMIMFFLFLIFLKIKKTNQYKWQQAKGKGLKAGIAKTMLFLTSIVFILLIITGISHAATYYVSPTGVATWDNCIGSTPLNGTSACSWQTAMANAVAGDVVYFRGGTYNLGTFDNEDNSLTGNTRMYPANSGTSGNPITFIAYPGEAPNVTGTVISTSQEAWFGCGDYYHLRNYITWDGFSAIMKVNTGSSSFETAIFRVAGDHCTIRNSNFNGVDVGNWQYNTTFIRVDDATNATIENNYFHGLISTSYDAVNTAAVYFNSLSNITTVRNNTVIDCEGGIYGKGNSANVSIYNNFIYNSVNNGLYGVWYKRSNAGGESATTRRVYQNIIVGFNPAIWFENGGVAVTGSLIYNNAIHAGNGTDDGIYIDTGFTGTEIFNNIIYNRNPSLRYYDGTVSYSNYNDFYRAAGNVWNRNYATNYTTLSAWTAATGFDLNSITTDPLFVNAGGANPADYKLQANSPARTSGRGGSYATVMGAYITGNETIGSTTDPTLQFSSATYEASESDATATITVIRIGSSADAVSVDYATSNGTATAGSDYTAASGAVNFAAGETIKTFTIPIINDTAVDPDETINLTLSNPTGNGAKLGSPSTAVLTILDNDGPSIFRFQYSSYSISEGSGTIAIRVRRTGGSVGAVSVNYATSNGTATAGSDYTAASGTLNWADGDTSNKTFNISITNDSAVENNETVNITLSNPTNGAQLGGTNPVVLTITDNDSSTTPPPSPDSSQSSASLQDSSGGEVTGGGCGYIKDDNGKGPKANGGVATFAIMLLLTLFGIAVARKLSLLKNSTPYRP